MINEEREGSKYSRYVYFGFYLEGAEHLLIHIGCSDVSRL